MPLVTLKEDYDNTDLISYLETLGFDEYPEIYPERWLKMIKSPDFYTGNLNYNLNIPRETKRWIRNEADEVAASLGMRFSENKGLFVVNWISSFCTLYEGDKAGELITIEDWQYEAIMQLFGWQKQSEITGEWIRRFNKGTIWAPKKCAKSPTLAAIGVYLFMGEGEQGQKCYSVAKDSQQAAISHKHATNMVLYSPRLAKECRVNNTTNTIHHLSSNSEYILVSSNLKSHEGFNGSVLMDETHVLSNEMMSRLKYAGKSRKQPLFLRFSTGGRSLEGAGYDAFKLSQEIESGKLAKEADPKQLTHYSLSFGVSNDVPFEKLYDKEWVFSIMPRICPVVDRLLTRTNFIEDYLDATRSVYELRDWALYVANYWLENTSNWIPLADWDRCAEEYTLDELISKGYPAVLGVDLSKTTDMTSLVLCFHVPYENGWKPYLYSFTWWLQSQVKKHNMADSMNKYSSHLKILNEPVIDYDLIVEQIDWLSSVIDIKYIAFDPYNSDVLVTKLIEDKGWNPDYLKAVRQNWSVMGPYSSEFLRRVLRTELAWPIDHQLFRWSMSHTQSITDNVGNERPVKPSKNSYQKIDIIVASIMAIAMYCNTSEFYEGYKNSILLEPLEDVSSPTKVKRNSFITNSTGES